MDLIQNLAFGFGVAVTPMDIFLCLIGALVGTLIGVLPGIGPLATIAMPLPVSVLCRGRHAVLPALPALR